MISTIIMPGTKLDMIRQKNSLGEEVEEKQYSSKVLDLMDDDTAKIAMPIENGMVIPLEVFETYEFIFYTDRGLYHCKGEIMERFKEGTLSVLIVRFESDVEKYQRRQYYRLEYIMDIEYRVITREEAYCLKRLEMEHYDSEEEKEKLELYVRQVQAQWFPATAIDISGGGCRFNSKNEHEVGQHAIIRISYTYQGEKMEGAYESKIVSSVPLEKRKGYFEHRVEFLDIDVVERETLIKFIFEEERKMRRRERGLR